MKSALLYLILLLTTIPALAQQRVVAGRITDRSTGQPISGCTVLQFGTSNAVSTGANGVFSLPVPSVTDTLSVVVSSIGYISQRRQVHLYDSAYFALSSASKLLCDLMIEPRLEAGILSGTRYVPFGATVRMNRSRYVPFISHFQASYQTNFHENTAAFVQVGLPTLHPGNRLTLNERLNYQWLQAAPHNIRFHAYSASVEATNHRFGSILMPSLVVGGGYATLKERRNNEQLEIVGFGYTAGLRHYFSDDLLQLQVLATATRWPGYWQLQGSAKRGLFGRFAAGVSYNQVRDYKEVSLALTRYFY